MRRLAFSLVMLTACSSPGGEVRGTEHSAGGSGTSGGASAAGQPGAGGANSAAGQPGSGGVATGGAGAGGSAGASGGAGGTSQAGSAGSAPVVVTPCDDLPEVGQWQKISPPEFVSPSNMETLSVVVNQQDQTVYATATNKVTGGNGGTGVLKSTDCGATFTQATTGLNADKLKTGGLWAMMIDPSDPQTLYVANGYGNDPTIYRSTNGGVDFDGLSPDPTVLTNSFVQGIAMDPENPAHIAVTFHDNCKTAGYNAMCLSQSTDRGDSWSLFNGPASLAAWQEGAALMVLGPTHYLYTADAGAFYTSDGGGSWDKVIDDGFQGSYAGSTTTSPDGTLYLAGGWNALYWSNSSPIGKTWTKIDGSPHSAVIINDGVSLIASYGWGTPLPFYQAKLSEPLTWASMPSPDMSRGSNQLAYDATHHIVYAANWGAGLWRLVSN